MTDLTEKPKIEITDEEMVEALEKAVRDRGAEFNYLAHYADAIAADEFRGSQECRYVEAGTDGQPEAGCIAGYVLHHSFGVPLEVMQDKGQAVDYLLLRDWANAFDVSPLAASLLRKAQEAQDGGANWGAAVGFALAWVGV